MSRVAPPGEPGETPSGPPAVSRFEYNLLRILRFVLGAMPVEQARGLIVQEIGTPPTCLGRTCIRLAEDTLAKGLVLHLVRAGGWRAERMLSRGEVATGRAWERHPLEERALELGPHPMSFLMWLTAHKPDKAGELFDAPPGELTPADCLFFALALDALRPLTEVHAALVKRGVFAKNPLCWLLSPGDFAGLDSPVAPDFAPWMAGLGAVILECWQPLLTTRFTLSERSKGQTGDWRQLSALGRAELALFENYLGAAESAGRPDLARFVLNAGRAVLGTPGELTVQYWTGGLQGAGPGRLADRLENRRLALAVVAQLTRLQQWVTAARGVGYFDEGYAASQVWKADWDDAGGDALSRRATELLNSLDPLRT